MTDIDRIRIEIAFEGNQVLNVYVPTATAEDLDRALAGAHDSLSYEAEDGRYTIAVSIVLYVKRFGRASRVGFGAVAWVPVVESRGAPDMIGDVATQPTESDAEPSRA